MRTAWVSAGALFTPGQSRAPDRRSKRPDESRARHDGDRCTARARREPNRRAHGAGLGRPVPRSASRDATRGAKRAPLRFAQRAPPYEEERTDRGAGNRRATRPSLLREMVRWLESRGRQGTERGRVSGRSRTSAGCSCSDLAPHDRVAKARPARSGRRPRLTPRADRRLAGPLLRARVLGSFELPANERPCGSSVLATTSPGTDSTPYPPLRPACQRERGCTIVARR